jgi:hypothetical protein
VKWRDWVDGYHEIIAVFESDCAVEVGEEDEFWVLERPVHGFEVGGDSHCEEEWFAETKSRIEYDCESRPIRVLRALMRLYGVRYFSLRTRIVNESFYPDSPKEGRRNRALTIALPRAPHIEGSGTMCRGKLVQ